MLLRAIQIGKITSSHIHRHDCRITNEICFVIYNCVYYECIFCLINVLITYYSNYLFLDINLSKRKKARTKNAFNFKIDIILQSIFLRYFLTSSFVRILV